MKRDDYGKWNPGPQDAGGHRKTTRRGKPFPIPKRKLKTNNRVGWFGGSGFKWDAMLNGHSPHHSLEDMAAREDERRRRAKEFGGPGF